ncbi:putative cytoplasm protein [Kockovaella imperatae]|uniref:Putative cytoplasm protein n=1 Tax=Kockovaella imperatae TaxID=4999 RepID=A0A1Y1UKS2_9TREE|nr:putative cytoplasm protein [Kockovaella imperatae]ORX38653.1 putative cytoplasm protein [Kockovaella imperatae]
MSTAKKLQTKLFGTPNPAKKSAGNGDSGDSTPAEGRSITPTPGSAPSNANANTNASEGFKIDIPSLNGESEKREKDNLPKRNVPPAQENGQSSPAPAEETDTPRGSNRGGFLRDRIQEEYQRQQRVYRSVENWRLDQADAYEAHWKRWGPYVSERQWGTVREDYSANGDAWNSFPFEMSTSRAYRWGEDGIAGISDNHQRLCLTLAFWNGKDKILKERLYGLNGSQGNHGEDVKEMYWYIDSTPTHSYMKYLYKYPQAEYPYDQLKEENQNRSREVSEFELMDTDVFDENRYWDIFVEYAKDDHNVDAMSIRITAYNRGPDPADLHIIPQMFFRNTWSWPKEMPTGKDMPNLREIEPGVIEATHPTLGKTRLYCTASPGPAEAVAGGQSEGTVYVEGPEVVPELLFTENETNYERLYNGKNRTPYVKDAFHDHIIPWHRPKEPEPEPSSPTVGLKQRRSSKSSSKSPSLPSNSKMQPPEGEPAPNGDDESRKDIHANGNGTHHDDEGEDDDEEEEEEGAEHIVQPPPTPRNPRGARQFVNPEKTGTKAGAHYLFKDVPGQGGCCVIRLKMTPSTPEEDESIELEDEFDDKIDERHMEADEFYALIQRGGISADLKDIMRQALAGMLWTKQYYQYIQKEWMDGDPGQPPPPPERKWVRNREWKHMYINDILSMPDKWEYPWFATWDTAFHCIPLAMVDPSFAKKQLDLMTREWYMKPDGALPAYEWNFSDVNPPVHAWATFRVFKIERKMLGRADLNFLERVFQKLLLNFTWWVNRKDKDGNNVFEGGFLGLDNIGPFNRSEPLPTGGTLRQADGTAWMAFFCLNMLSIALELAKHNSTYEDIASKFFEHFLFISDAMTYPAGNDERSSLWNEEDGFYYDAIQWGFGNSQQLPVRSMVGLMPLYATLVLEPQVIGKFKGFKKRMDWFIENRSDISMRNIANIREKGRGDRKLLALASKDRLVRILQRMLDEKEFLSDYGIRSMSLYHHEHPFSMNVNGEEFGVGYWPGDSKSGMFGGNSNWRGPIWFAVNFLLVESLQRFHQYFGDDCQVECPTGSGEYMNLAGVAEEIQHRLMHIFSRDEYGRRAVNGGNPKLDRDPFFRDLVHFYEFFHGNDGRGLGASHQTGWTGLVAYCVAQVGENARLPKTPRTPRSIARHYFDEQLNTPSEFAEDGSLYSAYSTQSVSTQWEPEPDEL